MLVVYNAFNGRYADNPRAVHEAWVARGDGQGGEGPVEHVWLADPRHAATFPPGVRTVPIASPRATEVLEAADVVVANCHLTLDPWRKAARTTYLQTWHGTPLKRIHRSALQVPDEADMRVLDDDIARWDLLVSPSPAATPLLREAFAYDGEVLETGYPRNDALAGPGARARRERTRRDLGLADGTRAVLYAPTWRDDDAAEAPGDVALGLDPSALLDALGDGWTVLLRLHYYVAHRRGPSRDPRVLDVSSHPDVADLMTAADVLVTDYSSSMFDAAAGGPPVLVHAHDLDDYRDRLRGFTLDLEVDGPSPVLRTQPELVAALRALDAPAPGARERAAAFRARWAALEDGRASDRVVDGVLAARAERAPRTARSAAVPADS